MSASPIRALSLCAVALLSGCDDDERRHPSEPGGRATAPGALAAPPPGRGEQITLDAVVGPGEEATYCRYFFLEDGDVSRFEHVYTKGSHHIIVVPTVFTRADVPTLDLFACKHSSVPELGARGIAYAGQVTRGESAMPEGVALRFEQGTAVLLQAHYLNTTEDQIDAHVAVNLWRPEGPVRARAGTVFFAHYGVYVPPNARGAARMRCAVPQDITFLSGMSHMHRHGVAFDSSLVGEPLAAPLPLYTEDGWEDVPLEVFDPPVPVRAGQSVEFQCDYENPGSRPIIEGPSGATDEMCVFIGLYYPKLDDASELCLRDGSGPIYGGASTCAEAFSCYRGARDRVEGQACMNRACEASSLPFDDLFRCLAAECGDVCPGGGQRCDTCLGARCEAQGLACAAARCP